MLNMLIAKIKCTKYVISMSKGIEKSGYLFYNNLHRILCSKYSFLFGVDKNVVR